MNSATPVLSRPWIIAPWVDVLFILLTPLLAAPAVMILYSSWFGVEASTISLIVTAFFALGHHLPGMMRAYGDRELFERFRWRFLLAPPLFFLAYFPLINYHYDLYRLIILTWATWHALMQLYGFVRIYDAKAGSVSTVTAYWDWLLCLCGFITPQLLRPDQLSLTLRQWYSIGGFQIPPHILGSIQWASLVITGIVFVGFCVNVLMQMSRGTKPSPLKFIMLFSGIGLWWFVMTCVDNLLVSIAIFDICHDVQYLAIVWLFNCRRVSVNPHLGKFIGYVFRRGMVLLYLGLIVSYGALGLVAPMVLDGTVSRIFYAIMFTSTILHYYLDGFIWKVRETTNLVSLGVTSGNASQGIKWTKLNIPHIIKWSPAIVVLGLLFATDILEPMLTTTRKNQLEKVYGQSLLGNPMLPRDEVERSWLFTQFEQSQIIAESVPKDRGAQLRAAIMLANFGRNPEALARLERLKNQHPDYADLWITLGGVHLYQGNFAESLSCYQQAIAQAKSAKERAVANLKLGEFHLQQHDDAEAENRFAAAVKDDPKLSETIDALRSQAREQKL